ncbi:30S ribosomal protein S9 [Candidatus Dependentiae bacterium]
MATKSSSNNFHGVGRRKSSVSRVWLKTGNGKIEINGKDYEQYFTTEAARKAVEAPFKAVGLDKKFNVQVNVCGGGITGQADAIKLGISRALLASDEKLRSMLRQNGLLTVDARVVERKKYGQRGARRSFQFVKR